MAVRQKLLPHSLARCLDNGPDIELHVARSQSRRPHLVYFKGSGKYSMALVCRDKLATCKEKELKCQQIERCYGTAFYLGMQTILNILLVLFLFIYLFLY